MKKYISIWIALFMAFGLCACSSDEDSITEYEYDYDELPAWLIPQAKELAESFKNYEGNPTLLHSISRNTGIHGEIVYHIYRAIDSCIYCNLYDENGNHVDYLDVFGKKDTIGDEGWKIIFPKTK